MVILVYLIVGTNTKNILNKSKKIFLTCRSDGKEEENIEDIDNLNEQIDNCSDGSLQNDNDF